MNKAFLQQMSQGLLELRKIIAVTEVGKDLLFFKRIPEQIKIGQGGQDILFYAEVFQVARSQGISFLTRAPERWYANTDRWLRVSNLP